MERYIQQLIEDLHEAATKVPEPGELWDDVDMENPAEIEDIAYVEGHIYGQSEKLSAIVGIETVQLPPVERLTERQAALLCRELQALLLAYRFVPNFPDGLPESFCYTLLREHWDDEQVLLGGGETSIEFCDFVIETCPFPVGFCECRLLEEDSRRLGRENQGTDDPPF